MVVPSEVPKTLRTFSLIAVPNNSVEWCYFLYAQSRWRLHKAHEMLFENVLYTSVEWYASKILLKFEDFSQEDRLQFVSDRAIQMLAARLFVLV